MTHPPDAGKMACRHRPKDRIAALYHVCKHCGVPIEAVHCAACNGTGTDKRWMLRCRVCRGTGIDRWEAVP